ncbi:MAG: cysteine--tRNA ligase [Patescibacteria group bacterium]
MRLYNTLSRKVEDFKPLVDKKVKMYACGPTVYDYTHLGHLRKYTLDDVLRRTLEYLGYDVNHVMNITDVGHLVSDSDEGEDKLEKGAKRTGKTVWEVAKSYTDFFESSMKQMNVLPPTTTCKATDHIKEMINLVKELEKRGFTYETDEAVYFDVTKDEDYGKLSGQKISDKRVAVRADVNEDKNKKNPADFALWFKRIGRFADHTMHWSSPWGDGFPGWHIECSAMSMKYLGHTIDIHTGGIDHIPVHHENEIAQSECATGEKPFVKYWVHHNFLTIEGQKMSKSLGNFYTIDDFLKKDYKPVVLRYLFLQSHYRSEMNFTWESLKASEKAIYRLIEKINALKLNTDNNLADNLSNDFDKKFRSAIGEDMNTAKALAILWEMLDSDISSKEKLSLFDNWNKVFGLSIEDFKEEKNVTIPADVKTLAEERKLMKKNKDFVKADSIRKEIEAKGFLVLDQKDGEYEIRKA